MPERQATVRFRHRLVALALGTVGVAAYYLLAGHGGAPALVLAGFGSAAILLIVSLTVVRDPPSVRAPVVHLTLPMASAPPSADPSPLPPAPVALRAPRSPSRAGRDGSAR